MANTKDRRLAQDTFKSEYPNDFNIFVDFSNAFYNGNMEGAWDILLKQKCSEFFIGLVFALQTGINASLSKMRIVGTIKDWEQSETSSKFSPQHCTRFLLYSLVW